MTEQFIPKYYSMELDNTGRIGEIHSEENNFLNLNLNELKNTSLLEWVFEPQKESVKSFLNNQNISEKTSTPHLGVWFTNRKEQYFWCRIVKTKKHSSSSNENIIIYDYTEILPEPKHLLSYHPSIYSFFQQLHIPLGITNIAGRWLDANPALCNLFGLSKDELLSLTWQDLTTPENLDQELTFFKEFIRKPHTTSEKIVTFEKCYVKKDKSIFRARVYTLPIYDKDTNSINYFVSCIENLNETESNLQEAEKNKHFIRIVLDLLPVRVFWKDKNLHYLGCNLAFAKDAGKNSPEELVGMTDYELPWKTEAESYRKDDQEVIASGKPKLFYEETQTTPDGRQIWLKTSKIPLIGTGGVPYGVLGIYEDITEFKSIINTLNETMSILKELLDSAPIGIIATNKDGHIEFWNQASEEILGWKLDEVFLKPLNNFVPEIYTHISQSENIHLLLEKEIKEKNKYGDILTLRIIHRYIYFSKEETRTLILFRDISEFKKIQKEKEQFQEQMQHTQKLESLGVLSSSIAHDFNNILMAIMGHTELAKEEINNLTAVKNYLLNIEEAVKNAGDLCRQLLIFAGRKQQPHQPCNLNHLIQEMEHLLKVSISKKIVLDIDLIPDILLINGEIGQLRSVILNLVINASDAIGKRSGVIRIKTGIMDFTESYIRTTWFQEGIEQKKYVFLEVSDNGCGMSPEIMSKIFDPFFTTKDYGRGLGLATIMGILRAHDGTIKVYSEEGKGTTFKLFFPAIGELTKKQPEIEEVTSWKGQGLILFADDEPIVLQVTTKMLEKIGFDVIPARDGREALQLFQENKNNLSAVVLDITMPHLDGTDVARIIRSECPNLPIFLSTGFSKHTINEKDIDYPIQGFLTKPYNINTLIKNLKEYL